MFTYIPATRGVLNCVDFIGTACSVAAGLAVLFTVGFTTAVGVVGSEMEVNQHYTYPQLVSHAGS